MPARLKLDFLQKYCTLERILDLPRTANLLEIAGMAVPLREKVRHVVRVLRPGSALCEALRLRNMTT